MIAHIVDEVAATQETPIDVLALASGHVREAEISSTIQARRFGRFIAFDQDAESLEVVDSAYAKFGVETVRGSVKDLLAKRQTFSDFDVVYAAGLFDYLNDKLAQRLVTTMLAALRPGGLMVVPNFMPDIHESIYMEAFMKWFLIYRTEEDMRALINEKAMTEIADVTFLRDPFDGVVYMICKKGGLNV